MHHHQFHLLSRTNSAASSARQSANKSSHHHRSSPMLLSYLFILLALILLMASFSEAAPAAGKQRRHAHHNKEKRVPAAVEDDYEYRDFNDYTSGVAVDRVKVSTTKKMDTNDDEAGQRRTTLADFQKTNRYPKMRKFFANSHNEEQRRWLEALFTQKKR